MAKPWEDASLVAESDLSPEAQRIEDEWNKMKPWEQAAHVKKRAKLQKEVDKGVERLETGKARYMTGREKFRSGMIHGAGDLATNLAQMALPESMEYGPISKEAAAERRAEHKGVLESGSGKAGHIFGQVAATLPMGGVGGGLARGAQLGTRALTAGRGLQQAARGAGRGFEAGRAGRLGYGARALGGAAEGATIGAAMAGPDDRLLGAAIGGGLGGALPLAGQATRKVFGSTSGVVPATAAARGLKGQGIHEIPLAQGAKPGLVKSVYQSILANLPGVSGKLRGQYKSTLNEFREIMAKRALPGNMGDKLIKVSDDAPTIFTKLDEFWSKALDPIKKESYKLFGTKFNPPPAVQELMAKNGFQLPKPGAKVSGEEVLLMRRQLEHLSSKVDKSIRPELKKSLEEVRDSLNSVMKTNLERSARGKGIWDEYMEMATPYSKYLDLQKAGKAAGAAAEFTPKQLAQASATRAGPAGLKGGGATQPFATRATEALPKFPSSEGAFQTLAAYGATSGLGGAALGGLIGGPAGAMVGAVAPIAIGKVLARPGVQQGLMGRTGTQKALADILRRNRAMNRKLGTTARTTALALEEEARR